MRVKLKELRKIKGWSQQTAAINLGLSIDMIKSVESGRLFLSKKTLTKIYEVFGCQSVDEILVYEAQAS